MQGWRAVWVLLVSIGLMLVAHQGAGAQGDYPGGYTLMPLQPEKIKLLSMTVDVSFHDNGETTFAEVQANYRLHNQDRGQSHTLTVAIPGYPAAKPAPKALSLQLNGKDVPLQPGNQQWWVADITLNPNQRANLVLTYSAQVGQGPLAHFRYPLELTAKMWPGRLESARFTISFLEPPNPQSWIRLTPEDYQLSAENVTWSYDLEDPAQPIDFLFIRPSLWQQIQKARRKAAQNRSAQAYQRLGGIYAQLATAGQDNAIFERYYPLAVASYARAQQLDPEDPHAYLALAQLYHLRASLTPEEAAAYTSLAINELIKALEHGAQDPDIQQRVVHDILELADRARLRGDFDAAQAYLQRLASLAQSYPGLNADQELEAARRTLAVDWARHVLASQGPAPAREVLTQLFGPDAVRPPQADFAQVNSIYLQVHTEPHQRTIAMNAGVRGEDLTLVNALAQRLGAVDVASIELIETDPAILHITLSFTDAQDLLQRQQALAQAIPPRPEWAMLRAVLQPQSLTWEKQQERWRTVETYEEQISLVTVAADAGLQALNLERAANAQEGTAPLDSLLADIWRREAQVWRDLAENSRARFSLTLYPRPGAPLEQTWSALSGEALVMTGRAVQYHIGTLALVGLALYGLFVGLTWLLFRK